MSLTAKRFLLLNQSFKQYVPKIIESDRSVPDVAKTLDENSSLLYQWVNATASGFQKLSGALHNLLLIREKLQFLSQHPGAMQY